MRTAQALWGHIRPEQQSSITIRFPDEVSNLANSTCVIGTLQLTVNKSFFNVVVQECVFEGGELAPEAPQVRLATASGLLTRHVHNSNETVIVCGIQLIQCPALAKCASRGGRWR